MGKFISNFEAACKKLKREPVIPEFLEYPEEDRPREKAAFELEIIVKANNGKEKMDLANTSQAKWHPIHNVIPDKSRPRGFRLAFDRSVCDRGYTNLGCRHACKSEELAHFLGKERADLYEAKHS